MNRPEQVTARSWTPPAPVVVVKNVLQFAPSLDVWSWNARPKAASQFNTTRLMECTAPRSTWIHCGSLNPLDHRVPVLPSTALPAGKVAFSTEEAVAGRPCDSRPPPPPPGDPVTLSSHSEYPYGVPRAVPFIRRYRPEPETARSSIPPSPVVVLKTVVQFVPSGESWIW